MLSMAWGRCHSISELGSVWETNFQTLPCCFGFKVRLLMNFCQKTTKRAKLLLLSVKLSARCRMRYAHQQWPAYPSNYGIHASVHFSQSLDPKKYLQIVPIMQKWPKLKNTLDVVSYKFKLKIPEKFFQIFDQIQWRKETPVHLPDNFCKKWQW